MKKNDYVKSFLPQKFSLWRNAVRKRLHLFLSGRMCATGTLLLVFWLILGASQARAQSTRPAELSLQFKNITLLDALRDLNRRTGNRILFKKEEVEQETKRITLQKERLSLFEAVTLCLEGTRLTCVDQSGMIIVGPQRRPKLTPQTISGVVYDETGKPLPGATIRISGTDLGTASDVDGRFRLAGNGGEQTLEVSFVGYRTAKVAAQPGKEVKVHLVLDRTEMEEVVVTGYQTIRKERMTGSTTTITAHQITGRGLQSMDEILNSTVSGLNLIASGRPGQDAQIQIRGVNSLTGSTDPMWIVDGMPLQGELPNIQTGSTDLQSTIFTSGIGNIAPDDIKSITVLKDAAATAIYGARAANGVIVVETKSGLVGKTRFNASVNIGVKERPVNNIDMMNTAQKIRFEREIAAENYIYTTTGGRVSQLIQKSTFGLLSQEEAEAEIARLSGIETDWYKEIYRTAITQQYNFSMSGGTEKTQHYVSLNYLKEKGTEPNNTYDKLGMNIKLTHNPSKKVRITGGLAATLKHDRVTASMINSLNYAMYANPYERPYDEHGNYAWDVTYDTQQSTIRDGLAWEKLNILNELNHNTNTNRYLDAELSLKVEWEICKGLMFTTHGVYNANSNHNRVVEGAGTYTNFKRNWFTYKGEVTPELVQGSLREATGYSNGYTFRNTLQWSSELNEKHFITLFAGQEISERTSYNAFNYSPVFDEEHRIVGFPQMNGIDGEKINFSALGNTGKDVSKLSSFFANASYSFMDRYILTAAIRYDGSDIIGNDNQFTPLECRTALECPSRGVSGGLRLGEFTFLAGRFRIHREHRQKRFTFRCDDLGTECDL